MNCVALSVASAMLAAPFVTRRSRPFDSAPWYAMVGLLMPVFDIAFTT
jgi:hypothetical protein